MFPAVNAGKTLTLRRSRNLPLSKFGSSPFKFGPFPPSIFWGDNECPQRQPAALSLGRCGNLKHFLTCTPGTPSPKGHSKGERRKIRAAPPTKHGARRPVACGGGDKDPWGPLRAEFRAPCLFARRPLRKRRTGRLARLLRLYASATARDSTGNLGMLGEPAAYVIRRTLLLSCFQGNAENSKGRPPILSVTPRPLSVGHG